MSKTAFGLCLVATLVLGSATASAQHVCDEDVKRLCPGIEAGGGRLATCLNRRQDQLSPQCLEHTRRANEQLSAFSAACGEDVRKHCADVPPGQGRVALCLGRHVDSLSPACAAREEIAGQRVVAFAKACAADIQRLCMDVQHGGGRLLKCLRGGGDTVEPACRQAMDNLPSR